MRLRNINCAIVLKPTIRSKLALLPEAAIVFAGTQIRHAYRDVTFRVIVGSLHFFRPTSTNKVVIAVG
ncbi:Uncharacterised protein [Klebsiella michiganensis]|uniref:Uncharacterized protein n=1 Tax=Klebsiella michiganensis TaxID=1134687 RepID=A0A7H4M6H1_9ENTR|nr:Uncharacterised protein [Klebsiella michiganensis]